MTSGNLSDEPIAYRDGDALDRLAPMYASPIADAFLLHDREIYVRCDDSVVAVFSEQYSVSSKQLSVSSKTSSKVDEKLNTEHCTLITLRRSRGYAPEPIRLEQPFPLPVLAVGGHLKNTFCLGKDHHAFVSHHIGDLENLETLQSFEEGIAHFQRLFDIHPEVIAHDLHPDYLSTKWATQYPISNPKYLIPVQHHHAHIASVMAEHGLHDPVIGIAADGTGYGPDKTVWGGEILVADLQDFERVAHLDCVPLPGGEQAIRQPWRMAAVYLRQAYGDDFLSLDIPFTRQLDKQKWHPLAQMISRGLNSPATSSLGRLFDAVAALIGVRSEAIYEGQAAIEMEMMATAEADRGVYPFEIRDGSPLKMDMSPTIRAIVQDLQQGVPVPLIAGRLHQTVAEMLMEACLCIRQSNGLKDVALSGGVFQNRLLLGHLIPLLESVGFRVYLNQRVPPNDGGLSLGQAAIASCRLRAMD